MKLLPINILLFSLSFGNFLFGQLNANFDTTFNYACNGIPCDYNGPSILINEIMVSPEIGDGSIAGQVHPSLGQGSAEWIELYNPDLCEEVDISCYFLGNYTFEGSGGFVIPQGTIIPPSGFCLIRGVNAPPVSPNLLVQNGGNVVEFVVPQNLSAAGVCSGGDRVWFPNAGGWFAFYDSNGIPQDAVRWGSGNVNDLGGVPCVSLAYGCALPGTPLTSYNNIPANRKTHASTMDASDHKDLSVRRIPDGGPWAGPGQPTYANCNAQCIPPGASSCNGTATVNVNGGNLPYTFLWNDSQSQTTQTAVGLCAGVYSVLVTDATGASSTFEIEIFDFVPDVSFELGDSLCLNNGLFTFTNFSPTPGPNDAISFTGNGVINDQFDPSQAGVGTHSIVFTFSDEFECTNSATDDIYVLDLPETSVSNNQSPYCVEETDAGLILDPVNGILEGNGVSNNIFNPSLAGVGNHNLFFHYTDELGCSDTTFLTVEVVGLPQIIINVPNSLCINDDAFDLSATPTGGDFTINGIPATTLDPGALGVGLHNVTYAVTDQNGCTNTASKEFTINPIPQINFDPNFQEDCPPLTASFTAETTPVVSCLWDFGDGNTSTQCNNVTHTYTQSGCFDVSIFVVDENGCSNEEIAEEIVCVFPQPVADFAFSPDTVSEFFTEVFFTNLSQNGYFYEWEFDGGTPNFSTETHPIVNYPEGVVQDYQVYLFVTSEFGCVDSISKVVPVVSDVLIYVPNTFTPDDDKFNELWEYVIQGIDINTFKMEVFNRWGELIWESRNLGKFWNGYYGNKKVKTGTYVWKITAKDNHTDEVYQWVGHVNVLY